MGQGLYGVRMECMYWCGSELVELRGFRLDSWYWCGSELLELCGARLDCKYMIYVRVVGVTLCRCGCKTGLYVQDVGQSRCSYLCVRRERMYEMCFRVGECIVLRLKYSYGMWVRLSGVVWCIFGCETSVGT